ncbi:protein of unknown function [Pseudorhizobium banfieldiae]|uniref:Uncharacterized protein n=1 Tax=Pseudorhizobium banfieldiae TaxID=1125847 RepID=L0NDJ8_9HYPH|nr:hypothetical protein [Pseudorhizobium banfieldiae]CAD6606252.1 hypothetical protein RNT25_01823 [arsenite-oxidising bacterium NT-25]CCF19168.1 protein of unknown function [Pseudorhizobium banfieldiae]
MLGIGITGAVGRIGSTVKTAGVPAFLTKADGSPITKADNSYILKGA